MLKPAVTAPATFQIEPLDLKLGREELSKTIKKHDPSRIAAKKLKVFISQGEANALVTREQILKFAEAIREAGVKNVHHEIPPGRGGLDTVSFVKALDCYAEPE